VAMNEVTILVLFQLKPLTEACTTEDALHVGVTM
jgi:hypothetical protein